VKQSTYENQQQNNRARYNVAKILVKKLVDFRVAPLRVVVVGFGVGAVHFARIRDATIRAQLPVGGIVDAAAFHLGKICFFKLLF